MPTPLNNNDMMTDSYNEAHTPESLYCELSYLLIRHRKAMQFSGISNDVELLKWSIEQSQKGSTAARFYLAKHGAYVLTLIKERLVVTSAKQHALQAA